MFSVLLSGLLALQSAGQPAEPVKSEAAKVEDKNKVICRRVGTTGSRLGKSRKCLTREQWSQQGGDANDGMARAGTISTN